MVRLSCAGVDGDASWLPSRSPLSPSLNETGINARNRAIHEALPHEFIHSPILANHTPSALFASPWRVQNGKSSLDILVSFDQ